MSYNGDMETTTTHTAPQLAALTADIATDVNVVKGLEAVGPHAGIDLHAIAAEVRGALRQEIEHLEDITIACKSDPKVQEEERL